jgi:hypothetical protein
MRRSFLSTNSLTCRNSVVTTVTMLGVALARSVESLLVNMKPSEAREAQIASLTYHSAQASHILRDLSSELHGISQSAMAFWAQRHIPDRSVITGAEMSDDMVDKSRSPRHACTRQLLRLATSGHQARRLASPMAKQYPYACLCSVNFPTRDRTYSFVDLRFNGISANSVTELERYMDCIRRCGRLVLCFGIF